MQEGENYIVYGMEHRVAVDLTAAKGAFIARWFDPATGMFKDAGTQSGGAIITLETPVTPAVLWLERKK